MRVHPCRLVKVGEEFLKNQDNGVELKEKDTLDGSHSNQKGILEKKLEVTESQYEE